MREKHVTDQKLPFDPLVEAERVLTDDLANGREVSTGNLILLSIAQSLATLCRLRSLSKAEQG